MNGVVEKPIKPERLLAAMQAVVGWTEKWWRLSKFLP
jgi:hypothetical protein